MRWDMKNGSSIDCVDNDAQPIKSIEAPAEQWKNRVCFSDGRSAFGILTWPNEAAAKSQADKVLPLDKIHTEEGELLFIARAGDKIVQVRIDQ